MNKEGYSSEAIVIDNGSGLYKVGFAGEDIPRFSIPNIIGITDGTEIYSEEDKANKFIGWSAYEKKEKLKLFRPLERGKIVDWDAMENMWRYTFENELKSELEHSKLPVLISAPAKGFKKGRKKMLKILFESFDLPGVALISQNLLSLFSTGRATGLSIEIGEGTISSVPCFEGNVIPYASNQMELSGKDITKYLQSLLKLKCNISLPDTQYEILQDIKEQIIFMKVDGKVNPTGLLSYDSEAYELPDGQIITIPKEIRYKLPEIIFKPSLDENLSTELLGLTDLINESLKRCDEDLRSEMLSFITISGGSSNIYGFPQRLQYELNNSINSAKNIKVNANSQRKNGTWLGGSMLASMDAFSNIMISRQEYDEYGEDIIYRKHF